MLIHRVTRCLPQATRYGGKNRSDQITECLRAVGAELAEIDFFCPKFSERTANLRAGLDSWWKLPGRFSKSYANLWTLGRFVRLLRATSPTPGILAWENTEDHLLGWAAHALGWRILAFPHNLNALYNCGALTPPQRLDLLAQEIEALSWVQAIFTISPDENNFLRLSGLQAELLPYHPAADFRKELAELRQARSSVRPHRILVLGSANNQHTYAGMVRQLQSLAQFPRALQQRVIVGGDATERLAAEFPGMFVEFAGRLPSARLNDLLLETAAIWIVQEAGTGVVTRVRDFTLAGIPVIANSVAARSWEQTPGVVVLDDLENLPRIIEALPAAGIFTDGSTPNLTALSRALAPSA